MTGAGFRAVGWTGTSGRFPVAQAAWATMRLWGPASGR
jgi:hypothetical protein